MSPKTRKHVLRGIPALLVLICLCCMAMAEGEVVLPLGVKALVLRNYPGYTVAAADGWGGNTDGQYALVLSSGEDNVLAIAEKGADDPAYAFTVENTNAVRDGEDVPGVTLDMDEGALYYTYGKTQRYVSFKEDGIWGGVSVITGGYAADAQRIESYTAGVCDGALCYTRYLEDDSGNVLERHSYPPIPVSEAYEQGMLLANFDIQHFGVTPIHGVAGREGMADSLLSEGEKLIEIDVKESALVLLVERPNGACRLRVADWDGAQYTVRETGDFTRESYLDTYHTGEGYILLYCDYDEGDQCMTFARQENGDWMLENLVTGDVCFGVSEWSDEDGEYPWSDMFSIDFASLPRLRWDEEI